MFEQDLQDEEIKKKKRRILAVLLILLVGTSAALPFVGVTGFPSAAAPEQTGLPADTVVPTDTAMPSTEEPSETREPVSTETATSRPTATSKPTATTSAPIPVRPTATEEFGGAGGGEPDASATPEIAPTDVPTDVPSLSTPEAPGELPVTGAGVRGSGRLASGLAAISLGMAMLVMGCALLTGEASAATVEAEGMFEAGDAEPQVPPTPRATSAADALSVRLVLGVALFLALVLIAGYTLRRAKRR